MKLKAPNYSDRVAILAAIILIPIAGVLAYAPYLSAPFLYDDLHTLRDNPALRSHLNPLYFFQHPEAASRIPSTLTRPLLTWTYALDFQRGHGEPFAFHVTNLALHLLNAFLIFGLTRRTQSLARLALPAALLFALHPLGSIEVGYAANRSTLLSSTFYLAALLIFARNSSPRLNATGARAILGVTLGYAAGLLTKEVAATLPAAVLLWHLSFNRRPADNPLQKRRQDFFALSALLALAAVFALFYFYRRAHAAPMLFPPARPWPVWQYAAAQTRVFWTYLRLLIFPIHLSLEHEAWVPQTPADLFSAAFIISALGLALLVGLSLRYLRRAPEASFAALFAVIYLLPTSSVVPLTVLVNENRPYLSILLLLWPLLLFFEAARERRPRSAIALLALLGALFAALLCSRAKVYASETAAFRDAVTKAPRVARAHVNLGVALLPYGRTEEARAAFKRALSLDPCSGNALTNLANLAWRQGHWQDAELLYRRALACDPDSVPTLINLADSLLDTSREDEAVRLLSHALALQPNSSEALGRLGVYYGLRAGDPQRGLKYLTAAQENAANAEEAEKWRNFAAKISSNP